MHPASRAALLSAALLIPAAVAAQSPDLAASRQAAFETLKDDQWVRLSTPDGERREGRLVERGPDGLVLGPATAPIRIPATSIDTVWTRHSSAKTGAIVGGVLLAAAGLIAAINVNESESDIDRGAAVGILGLGGAAAGALVGGIIGSLFPRWSRRFP